ncbi:MAG: hypothetical protein K6T80_07795 [Firmicutes bacterium]|nr:hypothetical protein [Bacillota bacterium]
MEPYEIKEMSTKHCIADIQASKPLYLEKLGWVELPQAKEILRCGLKPVSHFIPPREFVVRLPHIETCEQPGDCGTGADGPLMLVIKTGAIKELNAADNSSGLSEKETPAQIIEETQQTRAVDNVRAPAQNPEPGPVEEDKAAEDGHLQEEQVIETKGIKVSSPLF